MESLDEPQRNPFCRHYDDCLTKAAIKGLREVPCSGCEFQNDRSGKPSIETYEQDGACWELFFGDTDI